MSNILWYVDKNWDAFYGIEKFYITQLEECELKDINDREIYWIQYYNCQTPNGYNIRAGGEDPGRKEVCKIDINTNQILECYGSAIAAAELNNIDLSLLTKTCRYEEGHDTCGGLRWSYLDNLSKVNNNKYIHKKIHLLFRNQVLN